MTGRMTGCVAALVAAMATAASTAYDGSPEPDAAESTAPVSPAPVSPANVEPVDVDKSIAGPTATEDILIPHILALPGGFVTVRAMTGFESVFDADALSSIERLLSDRSPNARVRRRSIARMTGSSIGPGSAPVVSILDDEPGSAETGEAASDRHTLGEDAGAIDRGGSSRGLDLFRFTAEHDADGTDNSVVALAVESGFEIEFADTRLESGGDPVIGRYESAMQIPAPGAAALLALGLLTRRRRR